MPMAPSAMWIRHLILPSIEVVVGLGEFSLGEATSKEGFPLEKFSQV